MHKRVHSTDDGRHTRELEPADEAVEAVPRALHEARNRQEAREVQIDDRVHLDMRVAVERPLRDLLVVLAKKPSPLCSSAV